MLNPLGIMNTTPRDKTRAMCYLTLARSAIAALGGTALWLVGWTDLARAGLTTGLLVLVVVSATAYEVYVSKEDRAPFGFVLIATLAIAACISLPQLGTDKFVYTAISTTITAVVLAALRKWITK